MFVSIIIFEIHLISTSHINFSQSLIVILRKNFMNLVQITDFLFENKNKNGFYGDALATQR